MSNNSCEAYYFLSFSLSADWCYAVGYGHVKTECAVMTRLG